MDNRPLWSQRAIVSGYAHLEGLLVPERLWLAKCAARLAGARILDLGVGCARTSPYLLEISSHYIGLDYSPEMVACSRSRLPGVDFRVGDARELEFPDASFDLVVFSYNGIDYVVDHHDRSRVLHEVRRLLVPGGSFFFSSHNYERARDSAYDIRQISLTPHPLRLAWRLGRWGVGIANHLSRRRHEVHGTGWAILNDRGHNYRLLTHYIAPAVQMADLVAAGFVLDEAIGADGTSVEIGRPSAAKYIYYAATAVPRAPERPENAARPSLRERR